MGSTYQCDKRKIRPCLNINHMTFSLSTIFISYLENVSQDNVGTIE